jgi:hypothetical protein
MVLYNFWPHTENVPMPKLNRGDGFVDLPRNADQTWALAGYRLS